MCGKRILIVEDEALVALFAEEVLLDAGFEVVGPHDRLEAAVKAATREYIHGATLDINLAGELVWPAAEALHLRGIPFLFVTGFGAKYEFPPFCASAPRLAKPIFRNAFLGAMAQLLSDSAELA